MWEVGVVVCWVACGDVLEEQRGRQGSRQTNWHEGSSYCSASASQLPTLLNASAHPTPRVRFNFAQSHAHNMHGRAYDVSMRCPLCPPADTVVRL